MKGLYVERLLAYAVGRFSPSGVRGYIAQSAPEPVLRATREEAEADELAWLEASR